MLPFKPLAITQFGLCGLLLIGSIGPWVSAGFVSASGMDGDGVITLLCAIVIAGLTGLALGVPDVRRWITWIVLLPAAASLLTTVYDVINISTSGDEEYFSVSVGWGLWFALLASLGVTAVAVLLGLASRGSTSAAAPVSSPGPAYGAWTPPAPTAPPAPPAPAPAPPTAGPATPPPPPPAP
ncbi:hypothetical protein [Aeromicrobium alkaliterrae]|uniref:Uncharacterized protein n=1 Tax=Aeromicrobium alkaliterrae TaxID=302168 RepID=A0ABP4W2M6_9ACTN